MSSKEHDSDNNNDILLDIPAVVTKKSLDAIKEVPVQSVTVFNDRAEVTRVLTLKLEQGIESNNSATVSHWLISLCSPPFRSEFLSPWFLNTENYNINLDLLSSEPIPF